MKTQLRTLFLITLLILFFANWGGMLFAQETLSEINQEYSSLDSVFQNKSEDLNFYTQPQHSKQIKQGCLPSSEIKTIFKPKNLIIPSTLIAIGGIGTAIDKMNDFHLWDRKNFKYHTSFDDYAVYGMLGWPLLCNIFSDSRNKWHEQILLVGIGSAANMIVINSLKRTINEERPDHTPFAFPSGHTAFAFLGATIAFHEYQEYNPILAYSGFIIASGIGAMRIINNRHWLSDVIAGAGIGIIAGKLSYLVLEPIKSYLTFTDKKGRYVLLSPSLKSEFGHIYSGINLNFTF